MQYMYMYTYTHMYRGNFTSSGSKGVKNDIK